MEYYFNTRLHLPFEEAVERVKSALSAQGFGIITEIRIDETFKKKLDVDFRKYHILGACNPGYAHQALQAEDKIGTMLPCNVIVQEKSDREIEVAAINPIASMQAVKNPALGEVAKEVTRRLEQAVDQLATS